MLKSVLIRRLFARSGAIALALVLGCVLAAVAATLTLFTANYDGANVKVEWEVNTEADVTGFELSRKAATESSYTAVSSITPTGQRRYLYTDTNVYRNTTSGGTPTQSAGGPFTYRLTVRSTSGDQSYLTVLAGTPSAVQRSWGTIKSMFR
ncbi:MAG: hypothetical protein JWR44_1468 [Hymenobacter sp.]|nr:hypothetical protein [Hymenobacter sp.]